jgi:hypothetical protein
MKRTESFIIILFAFLSFASSGSDTLYYRFNNYAVVEGITNDTLIFELEIKSATTGTYLVAFQADIYFNTVVFGNNAQPVSITPLAMVGTGINMPIGPTNPTANSFRYAMAQLLPPYDPVYLSLVPTTSWGKLIRYKMLILDNSGNAGLQFNIAAMSGNTKFVKVLTGTATDYIPLVAANDLLDLPTVPPDYNLMFSELGDPYNFPADFVEIYNAGAGAVNFLSSPWFLTMYNGTNYQNVQLTGNINAGLTFIIGGTYYSSAYPGKPVGQTTDIIDNNGTVSFYLTRNAPYGTGILIDQYNGSTNPFSGKHAVRYYDISLPNTTFTPSEWAVTTAGTIDMTPGSHRVTLNWDGSSSTNWRDTANWTPPYVPDAGHNASVPNTNETVPDIYNGYNAYCHDLIISGGGNEAMNLRKSVETSGSKR